MKNPALLYEVTFFSALWMVFPESWKRSCAIFYAHNCSLAENASNASKKFSPICLSKPKSLGWVFVVRVTHKKNPGLFDSDIFWSQKASSSVMEQACSSYFQRSTVLVFRNSVPKFCFKLFFSPEITISRSMWCKFT